MPRQPTRSEGSDDIGAVTSCQVMSCQAGDEARSEGSDRVAGDGEGEVSASWVETTGSGFG